uniref:NADH dehydrogenase subunit 4L n=1 Tax=Bambusicaliscelis fanjingensis TaxID=2820089 RepID=A0A8A4VM03_9HEMI|nr:NADH dehydrogenase subunit 4L [Bambusicaliscelis fanjingensis]QTD82422.1 NADH dehydrogenase subunit 4L [Bambusicaliscelis fanjingensis]
MFILMTFFFGMISLVFVRNYFLLSLLSLEFLMISLFYFCYYYFSFYVFDFYFLVIYLVMGVCDGVLGLSLIVYLVRKSSFDYLMSLTLC